MDKEIVLKVLNLMLITQDSEEYTIAGLCLWVRGLFFQDHISEKEYQDVQSYISNNKPSKWSLDCLIYPSKGMYYWKSGAKAPRIRWIKKHLKRLS